MSQSDSPLKGVGTHKVAFYLYKGAKEGWTHEDMCQHLAKDICNVSKDDVTDEEWSKFVAQMNTRRSTVRKMLKGTYAKQPTRGRNGEPPKVYTDEELAKMERSAQNLRDTLTGQKGFPPFPADKVPNLKGASRGRSMDISQSEIAEFRALAGL